jgi:hypothetical protein
MILNPTLNPTFTHAKNDQLSLKQNNPKYTFIVHFIHRRAF